MYRGVNVIQDENKQAGKTLNRLAREQFKLKLMLEIEQDITVCQLENISYKEYLYELREIIDDFINIANSQ